MPTHCEPGVIASSLTVLKQLWQLCTAGTL